MTCHCHTRYVVYRLNPSRRVIQETDNHGIATAAARQWAATTGEEAEVWDRTKNLPVYAVGKERGRLRERGEA